MARRSREMPAPETIQAGGSEINVDGKVVRQRTVNAAAMVIDIKDRKIVKRLRSYRQDWQAEAWAYYRTTPLVGFGADFVANAMSRLRFHIAWQPSVAEWPAEIDPDDPPPEMNLTVFETAMNILGRLNTGQGLMEMARKGAYGLTLPGEVVVLGREELDARGKMVERFDAYSTSEIDLSKADKGEISIRSTRSNMGSNDAVELFKIDPTRAVFFRVWRPDPEFGQLAATPMQRILEQCEEQGLLRRYMRGASRSRLNAGIFEVPSEWGLGPDENRRDNGEGFDKLADDLVTALMTAISDEGSAATVVPYVIHAPMDTLGKARHITFARDFDALSLEIRRRLDEEIASGLDLPDQVLLGLGDVKFRNAEVITQEQFKLHLEPLAIVWVRSLSVGFLYPALEADGVDPDVARQFVIWYDAAAVTSDPDQSASSNFGYDRALLSGDAWRNANNYTEEDAPDEEELAARSDGLPTPILKPNLGGPPQPGDPNADPNAPPFGGDQNAPPGQQPQPAALAAATRPPRRERAAVKNLGRRLAIAESMCRMKVQREAHNSMRRAFQRIGADARSKAGTQASLMKGIENAAIAHRIGLGTIVKLGVNPQHHLEDELGSLHDLYLELVSAHQHKVVSLIAAAGRRPVEALTTRSAASWARAAEHSWGELESRLHKLAGDSLFLAMVASSPRNRALVAAGPLEGEAATLGEFDVTVSVPSGLIRDVLSIAGGVTIPNEMDPETLGGVSSGPIVDDLLDDSDMGSEGYEWMYGDSSTRTRPFEPHEILDGEQFVDFTDPILTNNEGFPEGAYYFPGDHAYCQCEYAQRIVDRVPGVFDPVAPSSLRERGLDVAPADEAAFAKSAVPSYREPYPIPSVFPKEWQTVSTDRPHDDFTEALLRARDFFKTAVSGTELTDEQAEALHWYTGSGHSQINDLLRGADPRDFSPRVTERTNLLREAVGASRTTKDMVVYRGVYSQEFSEQLTVGTKVTDFGFTSTSAVDRSAIAFSDVDQVLEIQIPAGTTAMTVPSAHEAELILPPGSTFQVTGRSGSVIRMRLVAGA